MISFFRGIGYPSLWPSKKCQEPLDVSNEFTFNVINGILSGKNIYCPSSPDVSSNSFADVRLYYLNITKICFWLFLFNISQTSVRSLNSNSFTWEGMKLTQVRLTLLLYNFLCCLSQLYKFPGNHEFFVNLRLETLRDILLGCSYFSPVFFFFFF